LPPPSERKAAENKKIIVLLNFPQNPTGYGISKDEAQSIVAILEDIAKSRNARVIAVLDDAYFGLFLRRKNPEGISFCHAAAGTPTCWR
jgi:aspartate/methionine/tyrosine aminotransferase